MDRGLYLAATQGRLDELARYTEEFPTQILESQLTPNRNTLLHVAAQFGHLEFAKEIMLTNCPSLLRRTNSSENTPLHLAAVEGHVEVVRAIIDHARELNLESGGRPARELLQAVNKDGDTALHMAVRHKENLEVVGLLTLADPEFHHLPNRAAETPLYLAMERGHEEIMVSVILENCSSPGYGGPFGTTAMHLAASAYHPRYLVKMVEHNKVLIRLVDTQGRTPLHYATDKGCVESIREILHVDKLAAYLTTSQFDKTRTALHISANVNSIEKMKEILSYCPDSWEMVDGEGQNIVHIAIKEGSELVLKYILQQPWSQYLLNQKNDEGDTPIHILAATDEGNMDILLPYQRVDLAAVNNQNMRPHDFIRIRSLAGKKDFFLFWRYDWMKQINILRGDPNPEIIKRKEEMKKTELEERKKVAKTHLIVGTLIATVTFAANFTLPGGYDSNNGPNQGMAILREKLAFKAFVITNIIAMIFSVFVVFMIFIAPYHRNMDDQIRCYHTGGVLLMDNIRVMVIAFMTGAYAVLPKSSGMAIAILIIGCVSSLIYYRELERTGIVYTSLRFYMGYIVHAVMMVRKYIAQHVKNPV